MKKIITFLVIIMLSCSSVDKTEISTENNCEEIPYDLRRALCEE